METGYGKDSRSSCFICEIEATKTRVHDDLVDPSIEDKSEINGAFLKNGGG